MKCKISVLFAALLLGFLSVVEVAVSQTSSWSPVIREAKPAVVHVVVEKPTGRSTGSGAIVSSDGYVLTAAHVVDKAVRVQVLVNDETWYDAAVVAVHKAWLPALDSPSGDVALLKIAAKGLKPLPIGDSRQLEYEEEIRVLGYPLTSLGRGFIASSGVVQGTRVIELGDQRIELLQHNAPSDLGHSGGPVINGRGEIIGVEVSAYISQLSVFRFAIASWSVWGAIPSYVATLGSPRPSYVPQTGQQASTDQPSVSQQSPCPTCPARMVLIPTGKFMMGDSFGEVGERGLPVHEVYVSSFYMDEFKVTNLLWDEVAEWAQSHGYEIFRVGASIGGADHPVTGVSWSEAVKWANARSEMEGLTPCYYSDEMLSSVVRVGSRTLSNHNVRWTANGYRLPTEAEWEKAARGGLLGNRYPWGNEMDETRLNYNQWDLLRATRTSRVGDYPPNGYGLYDIVGNLYEWCWDWYSESYYSSSVAADPRGPLSGDHRVLRGCYWGYWNARVASRLAGWGSVAGVHDRIGFRLVRIAP